MLLLRLRLYSRSPTLNCLDSLSPPFPTLSLGLCLIFAIIIAISDNLSYTSKYREISGIVKTVGQIPCSINSSEDVSMVLWFKDSSGSPIYSYDARNEKEPRHLTLKNDWGLRLYFRIWPSSKRTPALMIRELEASDGGYYRCRVDYKNSPTSNSIIRLKIIQPPTVLEVQDISQSRLMSDQKMMPAGSGQFQSINPNLNDITYMGPYLEGQEVVTIICTAYGGNPAPQVIWVWYENGKEMIDSSYELKNANYVTNELNIFNLTEQTHDLYTCQASNNNETKITHRVNLDIYLTPKHIELDVPDTMVAKSSYKLFCHSLGAYPTVKMEFTKLEKRIGAKYQIKADADNVTTYSILFTPEIQDDEETVYCRAENPWIVGKQIEAKKKLRVYYPPVVMIRFGSSKTNNFSEGESVLLECHVKSNPSLKKISWFHQGNYLKEDLSAGIIIKGFTLLLRQLVFSSAGDYLCTAENEFGKGSSQHLRITVNVPPRCADDLNGGDNQRGKIIPLALGQFHRLECNIQAWPPDISFYWTLQRSREIVAISSTGNRKTLNLNLNLTSTSIPFLSTPEPSLSSNFSWNLNANESESESEWTKTTNSNPNYPPSASDNNNNNNTNESNSIVINDKTEEEQLKLSQDGGKIKIKRDSPNDFTHQTFLPYEIFDEDSYGTVACWAKNSFGHQIRPCYFHIVQPRPSDRERERDQEGGREMVNSWIQEAQEEQEPEPEATQRDEMEELQNSSQSTGKRVKNFKTTNKDEENEYRQEQRHQQSLPHDRVKVKTEEEADGEKEKNVTEEVEILSSKLRGTLGITIILMGVVIFIGCFTGTTSWLMIVWKKQKRKSQQGTPPVTTPTTTNETLSNKV